MNIEILQIRKHLKKKLNPMRYEHTLSVSFTCMALAMRYGCDLEKAELAGLLHDCAKRYDDETIIQKCAKCGVELTESELKAPAVIHAKLGAWMAEHKYGINDPEILSAIACHTTGKPDMGLLDKILYIADYIEPRRDKAPNLPAMRRLAFEDLDEALYQILSGTLGYLAKSGGSADEMTQKAFSYCEALRNKKGAPEQVSEQVSEHISAQTEENQTGSEKGTDMEAPEHLENEIDSGNNTNGNGNKEGESPNDELKGINKNRRKGFRRQKRRRY